MRIKKVKMVSKLFLNIVDNLIFFSIFYTKICKKGIDTQHAVCYDVDTTEQEHTTKAAALR